MYDLAIIGLGPAGVEAAQIAIENSLNVIAFEKAILGGTCLNTGCVPTKAIIHSASLFKQISECDKLGINLFSSPSFEWSKMLDRKTNIVSKFNHALENMLSRKITLVKGEVELFINDTEVQIYSGGNMYKAKNIIIATGSKPVQLKDLHRDGKFIINSDDFYAMKSLPKTIGIIGSGAIGLEWAMILSNLNVDVVVIEKAKELSPSSDIDIQKRLERILKNNRISFYKDDFIKDIFDHRIELNSGVILELDCLLSAVGRVPVLPKITVAGCHERFRLKMRDSYETDIDNLFLIGDAAGEVLLAHAAQYQAKAVMNKILYNEKIIKKPVPSVIYTTPEIASVGLREQDIQDGSLYRIKKIPIGAIAKSWCDESTEGFVKVIISSEGLIKGAHVIGKDASNLISLFGVFIDKNIPVEEIRNMIFPHPSYSEIICEVLRDE